MTKYWAKRFKNIILTGMPASGKTTFGKIYAQHSGRLFLDFDSFIESTTKKSISQLFLEEDEPGFRAIEEKILNKLERRHNFVIAMGGGTLLKPNNIAFARKLGLLVTLEASPQEISKRIFSAKELRPMFAQLQTIEEISQKVEELLEQRANFYEQSDVVISTTYNTLDAMKLHLELIERRAGNREYMSDIYHIMTKKIRKTSKWTEKEETVETEDQQNF